MTRPGFRDRRSEPPTLAAAALQGLPGRVVNTVAPFTEADPAALLATLLALVGAVIGNGPHMFAGDVEHPARFWPLVIGNTSGGMKGTSLAVIERIVRAAFPSFVESNFDRGLSSGEGLIERVRDQEGVDPDDKTFIEGVEDKRLLVPESEFGVVLGRAKREGNVLSEVLRAAWDGTPLSTMTRKATRLHATSHHIVVIAHITPTELRAKLTESDVAGGLMNRFAPVWSKRSARQPDGGSVPDQLIDDLAEGLHAAVERVRDRRIRVERDAGANQRWREVYAALTPDDVPDGNYASVIARAVPQVLRLALTYALLDDHPGAVVEVRREHLNAAVAMWGYISASAAFVFGDLAVDRSYAKLAAAITAAGDAGISRTGVVALFGNNKSQAQIDELVAQLLATDEYEETTVKQGGDQRPNTRYRTKPTNPTNPAPSAGVAQTSLSSLTSSKRVRRQARAATAESAPTDTPDVTTAGPGATIVPARPDVRIGRRAKERARDDNGFLAFWDLYPLKKNRLRAGIAYANLIESGTEPAAVMVKLQAHFGPEPPERQASTVQAATWLNDARRSQAWAPTPNTETEVTVVPMAAPTPQDRLASELEPALPGITTRAGVADAAPCGHAVSAVNTSNGLCGICIADRIARAHDDAASIADRI